MMKDVCGRSALIDWNIKRSKFPHLRDIRDPMLTKKERIDIVLGTNKPGLLAVLELRVRPSLKDPVAHWSRLGCFFMGPSGKNIGNYVPRSHVHDTTNIININGRYSRPAKRAIPRGEETNKERRRSVTSPRRRCMVRPSSRPEHSNKRKQATGRREKTNE